MGMTRSERRRIPRAKRLKELHDSGVPKREDVKSGPRMPRDQKEMMMHRSGRHEHVFRGPQTRAEKRWWNGFWKLSGRGFTKTPYKGSSEKRKKRQEGQSKRWTQKRLNNNLPRAKKVEV